MKVKISVRVLNGLYQVGDVETRNILSGYLSPEDISKLTAKYPTLNSMAELKTDDFKNILGVDDKTVKIIKKATEDYLANIAAYDFLTDMPDDVSPAERVKWGKLIDATQTYGTNISQLKKTLNSMAATERKYLELRFGISNCCEDFCKECSDAEISEKLEIPVSELEEYGVKVLNAFTNRILEAR